MVKNFLWVCLVTFLLTDSMLSPFAFAEEFSVPERNSGSSGQAQERMFAEGFPIPETATPIELSSLGNLRIFLEEEEPSFVCSTSELTPEEVQAFKEKILEQGAVGGEFASDVKPPEDRKELENAVVLDTGPPGETAKAGSEAVKIDLPNKVFSPREVPWLWNNWTSGSFSFGLILNDSLRAGQCREKGMSCPVLGSQLFNRNSSQGFKGDLTNVYKDIKEMFDGNVSSNLSEDQKALLQAEAEIYNDENFTVSTLKRVQGKMIQNSILTDEVIASMKATPCNSPLCTISVYSLFDKHFNSWYSLDLVVGTVGPAGWGAFNKLFGWSGRRGFFSKILNESQFLDGIRAKMLKQGNIIGEIRLKKMINRWRRYGIDKHIRPLIESETGGLGGYYLLKGAPFRNWWADMTKNVLPTITDPALRGQYYKAFAELNGYARLMRSLKKVNDDWMVSEIRRLEKTYPGEINLIAKDNHNLALTTTERAKAAYDDVMVQYGQKQSKWLSQWDKDIDFDMPEWFARQDEAGFRNAALWELDADAPVTLYENSRHIRAVLESYAAEGDFSRLSRAGEYVTGAIDPATGKAMLNVPGGKYLTIYEPNMAGAKSVGRVSYEDLEKGVHGGKFKELFAKIDTEGDLVKVDVGTLPYIKEKNLGSIDLFETGWEPSKLVSPEAFAHRLNNYEVQSRLTGLAPKNSQTMFDWFAENGWKDRRYTSVLDRAIAHESELVKSYFSIRGGLKWTALPYGYWMAKRGFGVEDFSAYMLPDTMWDVTFYPGDESIYDDAFIDFFANEGSDQGDMFIRIINSLPWKMILNEVSEKYNPLGEWFEKFTKNELRDKTGNIAVFTAVSGTEDCQDCHINIASDQGSSFEAFFGAGRDLRTYILEDTPHEQKDVGQTLIAFAHHLNLKGSGPEGDKEAEEIDLVKARKGEDGLKTCGEALEEAFFGWDAASKFGSKAGGVLAFSETVSYVSFGWSGIMSTAIAQVLVAPKLQDCVDTEEGYYAHYFMPAEKEEKKAESPEVVSTEKVSAFLSNVKEGLGSAFGGEAGAAEDALADVKSQIESFVESPRENKIVEAVLDTKGKNSGTISAIDLFFYWVQGNSETNPSAYKTAGNMIIVDPDKNIAVEFDFEGDKVKVNGEDIITTEDHTRMSSVNTKIPAVEIPQRITHVLLPDTNALIFSMNASGEMFVKDSDILDCIKDGVLEQSALPLESDNLVDAFGLTKSVITDLYPNIFPREGKIIAEGKPRKVAEENGRLEIFANRDVNLVNASDDFPFLGKLNSIQFENGVIVVKPETNELLIWLKRHANAILTQDRVTGMKVKPTTFTTPDGCEGIALDVELKADPNSPANVERVKKFNEVLEKYGPYQVIDSEKFIFIFYEDEECNKRLKVINKETGEVYDGLIESITPTADGFKVTAKDKDGKVTEHDFKFSAENGVPMVTYNGIESLLRSLVGRNGSLWYDPETGRWYAENAQLLPLLEAFKQKGIQTAVGDDGTVKGFPGAGPLNIQIGQQPTAPWNIPSLPASAAAQFLFVAALFAVVTVANSRIRKRRN